MVQQFTHRHGKTEFFIHFCEEHHTSHGVHATLKQIAIDTERTLSQDLGDQTADLLLQIILRSANCLTFLLFILLLIEILAPDDLLGGCLFKRNVSEPPAHDLLEGRKVSVMLLDDLSHSAFDIPNTCCLRIFEIRINLSRHHVILAEYKDLLDDIVVRKHILNLLRCHILTVA